MYAGVIAMSLLGLGLYFTVDGLERLLCPWQVKNRSTSG
jgi:NitT/TauT family transport system permease protein